ncbi:hypothetical protein HQ560_02320, partial [bacterium]|nr:hypothetical protein [bacterium]
MARAKRVKPRALRLEPLEPRVLLTTFTVVDTGQTLFYDNSSETAAPAVGEAFYGQDAQHVGNQP